LLKQSWKVGRIPEAEVDFKTAEVFIKGTLECIGRIWDVNLPK
jgi:hypothetical protein